MVTNTKQHQRDSLWKLAPLFGSTLFLLLYFVATLYYPGGSQFDKNTKGFSWAHNYWCNLLNENAINGQPNPARPIALTAMMVLCLTLTVFWYLFPIQADLKKTARIVNVWFYSYDYWPVSFYKPSRHYYQCGYSIWIGGIRRNFYRTTEAKFNEIVLDGAFHNCTYRT
ncbi:MAG: hypothetical protein COW65_09725 [Cytophagales bacterium CG18_big_fil_WC_8_21_14_2_50_42_9]|nr:MAG: hypothetical protein COW65_09725 [Cytophagales bacterium CG18_big_fil_WC_8_21_14_2_50_42_9]